MMSVSRKGGRGRSLGCFGQLFGSTFLGWGWGWVDVFSGGLETWGVFVFTGLGGGSLLDDV
ncbi:hypothetical protein L195_g038646 [Trifolium pratense]|uniref:Uncharacterized protein n=1 Tax=Trifolium pratense TaxID=57577 RepID=A0A2K3LVQ4_TRIPR|nr:hypothetical protein L195_g038646 [Trifolium pratense]